MEFTPEQEKQLKKLLEHAETLERMSKKEEAWTIVSSSVKSIMVGVSVVLTFIWLLWDKFVALVGAASK